VPSTGHYTSFIDLRKSRFGHVNGCTNSVAQL